MTYINAFKSPEGIVLSADTQETIDEETRYKEKVEIGRWPLVEIAIGGAGQADLVDAFIKLVFSRIARLKVITETHVDNFLDRTLKHFYEHDVRLLKAKKIPTAFLIAARITQTKSLFLWATKGTRAIPIRSAEG